MDLEIIKELDKILPVVVRVHGDNHPELTEVAKLYAEIKEGNQEAFVRLKEITNDFTAPANACVTFEKVYQDLSLLAK